MAEIFRVKTHFSPCNSCKPKSIEITVLFIVTKYFRSNLVALQIDLGFAYPSKHINSNKTKVQSIEIVFCWNNCSGYSQEKCFKCNLAFPKLSRLKKGQRVKGF